VPAVWSSTFTLLETKYCKKKLAVFASPTHLWKGNFTFHIILTRYSCKFNIFTYIIKFLLLSSSYQALNFTPLKTDLTISLSTPRFYLSPHILFFFLFYKYSSTISVIVASPLCIHLSTFVLCRSSPLWPLLLFAGCVFYFK
jgi:ABC-type phosphate transport system permease subunit